MVGRRQVRQAAGQDAPRRTTSVTTRRGDAAEGHRRETGPRPRSARRPALRRHRRRSARGRARLPSITATSTRARPSKRDTNDAPAAQAGAGLKSDHQSIAPRSGTGPPASTARRARPPSHGRHRTEVDGVEGRRRPGCQRPLPECPPAPHRPDGEFLAEQQTGQPSALGAECCAQAARQRDAEGARAAGAPSAMRKMRVLVVDAAHHGAEVVCIVGATGSCSVVSVWTTHHAWRRRILVPAAGGPQARTQIRTWRCRPPFT